MRKIVLFTVPLLLVLGLSGVSRAQKPEQKAESRSIKGEVIDTYCYGLMGAKGESHRQCGMDCAKAGIPVGFLEEGTGKVYVLLPSKDKSPLPAGVAEKMGQSSTITGKVVMSGGTQFLTVESIK